MKSVLEIDEANPSSLVLGPALAGTLMSPQEFDGADAADENFKYELIQGMLVVTPPPLEESAGLTKNWPCCCASTNCSIRRVLPSTIRSPSNTSVRPVTAAEPTG